MTYYYLEDNKIMSKLGSHVKAEATFDITQDCRVEIDGWDSLQEHFYDKNFESKSEAFSELLDYLNISWRDNNAEGRDKCELFDELLPYDN